MLGSCTSPHARAPRRESAPRQVTAEEFRAILAEGTIRPVQSLAGQEVFKTPSDDVSGVGELADPERVLAELESQAAGPADPEPAAPAPPANPYLTFGERIKVYPDGTITKPFPLRVGTGAKMKKLLEDYGNFPLWDPALGAVSTPDAVKLENLEKWDVELYQDLRKTDQASGAPQDLADWLVVTTGYDLMLEVEDFINLFAAGVPQIEIEAKIVEITFSDTLDLGSETKLAWPGKTFVQGIDSSTPASPGALGVGLALAAVQDGVSFDATLQALATRENVSIISQPKIAVREGGRADIVNTTKIPYLKITGLNNSGGYNASIDFQDVGVKLYVVPRVVGTQTVALNIDVEASQQSGNQTTLISNSDEVAVPIISIRGAHTVVYLQPGQAVILGGLISERTVERVRKTPLLGDIPLIKLLFRSKFQSKEQTNVLFFIRPRILRGAELHRDF